MAPDDVKRDLDQRLSTFVAISDGEIVGEAYAERDEKVARQNGVYVTYSIEKGFRGAGLIYRLLDSLMDDLERRGVAVVYAVVYEQNLASRKLMEKLGARGFMFRNKFHDEKRDANYGLVFYRATPQELKMALKEQITKNATAGS